MVLGYRLRDRDVRLRYVNRCKILYKNCQNLQGYQITGGGGGGYQITVAVVNV